MGRNADHFHFTQSRNLDWLTGILLLALSTFGLFLLATTDQSLFLQQFIYVCLGVVVLIIFSRVERAVLWWAAPIAYGLAIVLLLMPFAFPAIRGAHRWIFIGPQQFQPSELVKPLLLLAYAGFISRYSPRNVRWLPLHIGLFLVPFLLVFRQPDLGTAIVYAVFWAVMLISGGLSMGLVAGALVGGSLFVPLLWKALAGYQKSRILTFLNPALDPKGAGYNALQAMIAVGSGQFFGRGLGRGTQSHLRFLPEYHTDFIFASLVEELGFIGGVVLLVGYLALLWRIIAPLVGGAVEDLFHFSYAAGLFAMLLAQLFINAGMNMGLLPITGITLPLVSYGGSSILSVGLSFGLLWALQREKHESASIAIR